MPGSIPQRERSTQKPDQCRRARTAGSGRPQPAGSHRPRRTKRRVGARLSGRWLPETVRRDQWGFILTGSDTGEDWPLQRAPLLLETTTPGVFAVGDVRHGSMKRVASAVGDGSTAIRLIHDYLALAPPVREGHESRLPATRAIRHLLRNA
jgi:hypothetical protein